MVSEAELLERLKDILRSSDLSTTTATIVRRKLESDFDVDLSEKKAFIRDQIDIFLGELNEIEVEGKTEGEGEVKQEEVEEEGGSGGGEVEEEKEVDEKVKVEEKEGSINAGTRSRKRSSDKPTAEVKKRRGGFRKLCSLSPQLQEFVSVPELARTEVVKRLWAYIRENNLQDPTDKRKIICDERLLNIFKVKKIDMFQMNKALSKHIWTLTPENVEAAPKEKPQKKTKDDKDDTSRKGKRQKKDHSKGEVEAAPKEKPQKKTKDDKDDTSRKGKRQKKDHSKGEVETAPEEKPQKKTKDDKDDTSRKGKRQKKDHSKGEVEAAPKEKPQKKTKDDKDDTSRKGKRKKKDHSKEEDEAAPKEKQQKKTKDDNDDTSRKGEWQKKDHSKGEDDTPEGKQQKGAFLTPLPLSDALTKFFGTGETELSRSDVVKRLWDYIKGNNLQDPSNRRNIICDERLKELFQLDSFNGFTVVKLLSAHIMQRNNV